MATFFTMPKLGMNMVEGHIVGWLAKEGEPVREGQPLLEIETDKATNEVESPASGILAKILHAPGEDVACNGVLAVILKEGETMPTTIPAMVGEDVAPKTEVGSGSAGDSLSTTSTGEGGGDRVRISPSAKKLAEELGVDMATVTSSGSQIKREDVQRAYDAKHGAGSKTAPSGVSAKAYSGIRKLTGDAMAASTAATARVPLFLEANAEGLIKQRQSLSTAEEKVSFNVLLAKIAGEALAAFPVMKSQLAGDQIWEYTAINIGIAVDSEKGLFVPVLKDVNKKDIPTLNKEFNAIAERAMSGKATSDDLGGGTFTITNLGAQEIESFVPVIKLPECAILGVGAIIEKAVVVDGKIIPQHRIGLTLVFDHRLVDGAPAAKFLQKIKHLIEELDQ
jgi:pyruvate dehydrogenase E2 component (dihydrolipoamide acetyltransferase)